MSYEMDYNSWLERQKERLTFKYKKIKSERDTLIDDLTWYKAKVERLEREKDNLKQSVSEYKDYAESHAASYLEFKSLEHENKRLTRLTHKLTIHRTMWNNLKDWRKDMLEIDKNDTQLIGLGLVMDELEKRHLYKERE